MHNVLAFPIDSRFEELVRQAAASITDRRVGCRQTSPNSGVVFVHENRDELDAVGRQYYTKWWDKLQPITTDVTLGAPKLKPVTVEIMAGDLIISEDQIGVLLPLQQQHAGVDDVRIEV